MTISDNPRKIFEAPIVVLFIPDAQTLFKFQAGTELGIPDFNDTYLAGF